MRRGTQQNRDDVVEILSVFGRVKVDEPLVRHTSFRIGGPADYLVTPTSTRSVPGLIACVESLGLPLTVLGNGSNTLVLDGGIEGVVVRLSDCNAITPIGNDGLVAESGVPFPRLAREAARRGLSGLEFAVGIPGTVGGAVRMNAGAFGGQLADVLECIDIVTMSGDVMTLPVEQMGLGYRSSKLPHGIILTAVFALTEGVESEIQAKTQHNLDQRAHSQPVLTPSAGSFFKNPPGDYAARLIEEAGCKEWEEGDAAVSEKHANFFVNHGRATAHDVMILAERVKEAVARKFGVELEMEVRTIGRRLPHSVEAGR
ncbi:MAG: UDP-N-acetylmuramate dehydrogenase [Leptospirillia bacterium]